MAQHPQHQTPGAGGWGGEGQPLSLRLALTLSFSFSNAFLLAPLSAAQTLSPGAPLRPGRKGGECGRRGLSQTALPSLPTGAHPLWTVEKVPWGPQGGEG